jgi:hypothetical protein
MTSIPHTAEREAFETWAKDFDLRSSIMAGHYKDVTVHFMWKAWQARAALEPVGEGDATAPTGAQADSALPLVADTLADADKQTIIQALWCADMNYESERFAELARSLASPARAIPEQSEHLAKGTQGADLTDSQIDEALEAWFASGPVGADQKTDRTRMRAAIDAAQGKP